METSRGRNAFTKIKSSASGAKQCVEAWEYTVVWDARVIPQGLDLGFPKVELMHCVSRCLPYFLDAFKERPILLAVTEPAWLRANRQGGVFFVAFPRAQATKVQQACLLRSAPVIGDGMTIWD